MLRTALSAVLVVLASTGTAARISGSRALAVFDLDREWRFAAVISAALLVTAGYLLFRASRAAHAAPVLYALPLVLIFMALDELGTLHEHLERTTGVDWQVLYSPLILAAAMAWVLALRLWGWRSAAGLCLLMGAACWGLSQILEALQWNGDVQVAGYSYYMVVEELLEASGSAMFAMAGSAAWRRPARSVRTNAA